MTDPTYTLAEARRLLALENCRDGHTDLTEVHSGESMVAIVLACADCGTVYAKKDDVR